MSLTNKFMNRIFRRVHGLAWDLTSGKVGVKTENGIYTFTPSEGGGQVSVNPLDSFSMALPAFAMQTKKEDVQVGDLILNDKGINGWVVENLPTAYRVMDHNGHTKTYNPPKVTVSLGGAGDGEPTVMVVRNLMSLTGGEAGANGFAGNLLPLLLLSKDKSGGGDIEKLLPFLLMGGGLGGGAQAGGMNALLPLLLMKDGGLGGSGGSSDLIKIMALTGGLGGGAQNPLALMALMGDTDLFGGLGNFDSEAPTLQPTRSAVPPLTRRY